MTFERYLILLAIAVVILWGWIGVQVAQSARHARLSHHVAKRWVCPELPNGQVITSACMLWLP